MGQSHYVTMRPPYKEAPSCRGGYPDEVGGRTIHVDGETAPWKHFSSKTGYLMRHSEVSPELITMHNDSPPTDM
ncbi:Hypothetical predicted protein [Olea europaea subsp. europaea]|uniref:Uncharacterized protein n=1 Tax=Olea europaea subsp. europaea TaxID=158383 RepID=A0A8S0UB84_OLEEU|nr:Hypothetical predicted protein [Olea europaea subsp. europaea]